MAQSVTLYYAHLFLSRSLLSGLGITGSSSRPSKKWEFSSCILNKRKEGKKGGREGSKEGGRDKGAEGRQAGRQEGKTIDSYLEYNH